MTDYGIRFYGNYAINIQRAIRPSGSPNLHIFLLSLIGEYPEPLNRPNPLCRIHDLSSSVHLYIPVNMSNVR